jgi:excisionase family DNA binding protein
MTQKLLTVDQAAERLALQPSTMRKLIYARRIPFVKLGRAVRLREEDLDALIRVGLQPTTRKRA